MSDVPQQSADSVRRIRREIALFRRIHRWCLQNARLHLRAANLDLALRWCGWAALLYCDQRCGTLVSPQLERTIRQIARCLPVPNVKRQRESGPRRWLHVFTYWEPTGGHSALALRWIAADPSGDIHSIVLVEQTQPLPDNVGTITLATGGLVHILASDLTPSERAMQLRALAWSDYDVVVLHLHQQDAISPAAFGVSGGPPVIFHNAADHMFWAGAGVADLTIHFRALAEEWGRKHRGLRPGMVLPIPLPTPEPITPQQKAEARRALGLPADACVLLSIGSSWKFAPMPGADFTQIADHILQACPTARLVIVGPKTDERWQAAIDRCGGRLAVYSARPNLRPFHEAADLYLDPMPLGSLTALLEVAALGIPSVLLPRSLPYPLFPYDGALSGLQRSADLADYVLQVCALIRNPDQRNQQGLELAQAVQAHHCGAGWLGKLTSVVDALPRKHRPSPVQPTALLPDAYTHFWHDYLGPVKIDEFLHLWVGQPKYNGLCPHPEPKLWETLLRACCGLPARTGLTVLWQLASDSGACELGQLETAILTLDDGRGFRDELAIRQPFYLGSEDFSLVFDTAGRGRVCAARWAPPAGTRCKIRLNSISFRDDSGAVGEVDPGVVSSNGFLLPDGTHLFATVEPLVFFPVYGNPTAIHIRGRRLPLDSYDEGQLDAAMLHLDGPAVALRQPFYLGSESFALTFDTSGHGPVRSARLAPPAGNPCKVRLDSIHCEDASGLSVAVDRTCIESNGFLLKDGAHLFATVEPLFFLPIEGEWKTVTIRGHRSGLDAREERQLEMSFLYLEDGADGREGSILCKPVYVGAESFTLTFDLDPQVPVRSARWAPLPFGCCMVRLASVHCTEATGDTRPVELADVSSNGTVLPNGTHLFSEGTPLFALPIAGNIATITIEGRWWGPLSEPEVELEKRQAMTRHQAADADCVAIEQHRGNPSGFNSSLPNRIPTITTLAAVDCASRSHGGDPKMSDGSPPLPGVASVDQLRQTWREIALFHRIQHWCLRNARQHLNSGNLDLALRWCGWAALLFCDQRCGALVSPQLERSIRRIARRLPIPSRKRQRLSGPRRWLHVFTHWEPTGGHSALALRWIAADPSSDIHSIVLVEQKEPLPENVRTVTGATGGQVYLLDPGLPATERATRLRMLAWSEYDVVVLHLHQQDAVSPAAFGVPGGPPVIFHNAADHMFWVGAGVADLAIHFRPLAEEWGRKYRGLGPACVLPIPLPKPQPVTPQQRAEARKSLGLPPDACVLLSIGSGWKFAPIPGVDFTQVAEQVLSACPTARLVVVGPTPDERWKAAIEKCGGRLEVYSARPQLRPFHEAADVYLDPMPHGSLTALLEVAALGVPCVLQPRTCWYPLYPDDGALGILERPADLTDYVRRVRELVCDTNLRRHLGAALGQSVLEHHCGSGWSGRLASIVETLPDHHRVYAVQPPSPPPDSYVCFWHEFSGSLRVDEFLRHWLVYPTHAGMCPRLDPSLWQTLLRACQELTPLKGGELLEPVLAAYRVRETSLFVDTGAGYSQSQRVCSTAAVCQEKFALTFDVSTFHGISELRWDPVENLHCKVQLESVSYQTVDGSQVTLELARVTSNGAIQDDGSHLFGTIDPMFFLPVAGDITKVTIEGRWWTGLQLCEADFNESHLFVEDSSGYDASSAIKKIIFTGTEQFSLTFDTAKSGPLRSIRWDPMEGKHCKVRLDWAGFEDANGNVVAIDLNEVTSNGVVQDDGFHLFGTIDPMFFLPIEDTATSITFRGRWQSGLQLREADFNESHLFVDDGRGFNSENSVSKLVYLGEEEFSQTFHTAGLGPVRLLRWDPVEGSYCKVRLEYVRCRDATGKLIPLDLDQVISNGVVQADGSHLFGTTDPSFSLPVQGTIDTVTIAGQWWSNLQVNEEDFNQTSLFVDNGYGFRLDPVEQKPVYVGEEEFALTFPTTDLGPVRALRWDPVEGIRCKVQLEAVTFKDFYGNTAPFDAGRVTSNGTRLADGSHLFATTDPQFYLPVHGDATAVALRGRWRRLTEQEEAQLQQTTLYLEEGQGFHDGNAVRQKAYLAAEDFTLTFDLTARGPVRSLRWDPAEGVYCKVRLDSLSYREVSGKTIAVDLERVTSTGLKLLDGAHLFGSTDPMFFLPIQGEVIAVTIRGRWAPLSQREVELETLLERSRQELAATRAVQRSQAARRSA